MRAILGPVAAASLFFVVGCDAPAMERLAEARQLAAELLVQFNKASDATDRVVMAASERASASFAQQADLTQSWCFFPDDRHRDSAKKSRAGHRAS